MNKRRELIGACGLLLWLLAGGRGAAQGGNALRVAAAADLTKAFTEIAAIYEKQTGQKVTLIFGASGQLTQQIANGAPYDLFAAANVSYIETLEKQDRIVPGTKTVYGKGRLVLWTRKGGPPCPKTVQELTAPQYAHIAIANPKHAPYGVAAQEAMQSAKVWEAVRSRLVYGENIQQTLQFATSGNADVAIVALSLAIGGNGNYALIPEKLHRPLRQAMAILKSSAQPANARRFLDFAHGKEGRALLKKYGFAPL